MVHVVIIHSQGPGPLLGSMNLIRPESAFFLSPQQGVGGGQGMLGGFPNPNNTTNNIPPTTTVPSSVVPSAQSSQQLHQQIASRAAASNQQQKEQGNPFDFF